MEHLPSDLKDVAQWLRAKPEELVFTVGLEPIEDFKKQILEMESSYSQFPKDGMRTDTIERMLRAGAPPKPVYVELGDECNFIMEGRHRIVAFHRLGMTMVPVARVLVKTDPAPRPRPK